MALPAASANRSLDDVKAGVLYKRSRLGLFWKKRWVHASNGVISYSTDPVAPKFKNTISLSFATIQVKPSSRSRYRFEITTAVGQRFEFAADTPREVNEWIRFLRQQLLSPNRNQTKTVEGETDSPEMIPIIEDSSPGCQTAPYPTQLQSTSIAAPGDSLDPNTGDVAWNEMYQSIIEQNEATFDAAVSKAQALNQLIFDFVSTSMRIASTIIQEYTLPAHLKSIQPLDRNDQSPEEETFMSEGIVFQYMQEPNGSDIQDELRRKTCTHDVHGIQAYANSSVKGLHTYLCCVVDYFGFRLFCLALVPIYDDSRICFGRIEGQYHIDASANQILEQAAAELGLASHLVPSQDLSLGNVQCDPVTIHSSSSLMVHRGEDERMYVTNLTRAFPTDHNFGTKDELSMKQLRPEFLKLYKDKLSPDAFVISGTNDSRECEETLEKALHHLKHHCIQEFVKELDLLQVIPIDSAHFTSLLHSRGINVRYLGLIAENTRLPHLREVAICEMVARCCKQLLNQKLRKNSRSSNSIRMERHSEDSSRDPHASEKLLSAAKAHIKLLQEIIAEFFSTFLSTCNKSAADFWRKSLADRLEHKFAFKLKHDEGLHLHRPLLLASLQYHCGVWLSDCGANCHFDQPSPVSSNDIRCIEPRCKWPIISNSKCNMFPYMAEQYMEDGEYDMATQALRLKLDVILCDKAELVAAPGMPLPNPSVDASSLPPPPPPPHLKGKLPAVNSEESVYSPHSIRSQKSPSAQLPNIAAEIHSTLNDLCEAYICNDDINKARVCAKRALELSRGPDARTSTTYSHLVNIYQTMGQTSKADQCLKVALSMLRRLYGSHHPLSVRLLDDVGNRYIELGLYSLAESSLLQALEWALISLGKTHPVTAELYSSLGRLYQLENSLDKAKDSFEKACLIYEGVYGAASVEVAKSCSHLSEILSQKGDPQMAKYYQQRSLKTRMQLDDTSGAYFIE